MIKPCVIIRNIFCLLGNRVARNVCVASRNVRGQDVILSETRKNWKGKKKNRGKQENKSQSKQLPCRSRCSSQSFEKQPGEIPWEASLCSGRNSSPLTFAWDWLNHVIGAYFSRQPYASSLHTREWFLRDKQASTVPFFPPPALVFMVGASFPTQWPLPEPHWS